MRGAAPHPAGDARAPGPPLFLPTFLFLMFPVADKYFFIKLQFAQVKKISNLLNSKKSIENELCLHYNIQEILYKNYKIPVG